MWMLNANLRASAQNTPSITYNNENTTPVALLLYCLIYFTIKIVALLTSSNRTKNGIKILV